MSKTAAHDDDVQLTTMLTDAPDKKIRAVVDNARRLSPADERLTDHTADLVSLSRPMLSTLLFEAEPHRVCVMPPTEGGEPRDGTMTLWFEDIGKTPDGSQVAVTVEIRADYEATTVETITVKAERCP